MKQLIQSFKIGELGLFEVPAPVCEENGALVQMIVNLVSADTEKILLRNLCWQKLKIDL